ncbi:hypothetical protein Tco_1392331 [Tanacetum coccineum]
MLGEIRHPGLKLSLVLRFRINCVLRRFGRQTSGLLNANCKKALNLLKKGLLVQGEAKTTSKRSDHLKMEMEMEIPSVKASANSDIIFFFTSAQDGNRLLDDERLSLADDLKKAHDHNQNKSK